jgi:hypothetical protein
MLLPYANKVGCCIILTDENLAPRLNKTPAPIPESSVVEIIFVLSRTLVRRITINDTVLWNN